MTVADDQPEEAPVATTTDDKAPEEASEATPEPPSDETPEEEPEDSPEETPDQRLETLGAHIDEVRQQLDDPIDDGDRSFVESGGEGPVDDTIVPPG